MRKVLYYISLFLTLCLLASCRGAPGINGLDGLPGRDGKDGRDGLGVIESVELIIPQDSWQYSYINNNNFFFYTFNIPEITEDAVNYGLVKMYRYNDNVKPAVQIEMPYVRPTEFYDEVNKDWLFYTETVDYDFSKGQLTIYYSVSDFVYELYDRPEDFIDEFIGSMRFRLVVMH